MYAPAAAYLLNVKIDDEKALFRELKELSKVGQHDDNVIVVFDTEGNYYTDTQKKGKWKDTQLLEQGAALSNRRYGDRADPYRHSGQHGKCAGDDQCFRFWGKLYDLYRHAGK